MKSLPVVTRVIGHKGQRIAGSFLDTEYVFHLVEQGHWSFRMRDREYHIEPGSMILLPPRLLHVVKPEDDSALVLQVVHFEIQGITPLFSRLPLVVSVPSSVRDDIGRLFQGMRREFPATDIAATLLLSGLMTEIIGVYVRHCGFAVPFRNVGARCWHNVESALAFIHSNCSVSDLNVTDISRASGLSVWHFCRKFKELVGLTPYAYLKNLRIEKAKDLLVNTKKNCSEVADETGFSGIHAFSKVFKQVEGIAPTEWQRRAMQ